MCSFTGWKNTEWNEDLMSYIEETANHDEKIVYTCGVKIFPLLPPMLFGAFLALVAFSGMTAGASSGLAYRGIYTLVLLAGLYPFFFAFMHIKNTEIGFTDKRFVVTRGILRRSVVQLNTRDVNLIIAGKGVMGRLFNYGTIAVFSSGSLLAVVKGVGSPDELLAKLHKYQDFVESEEKESHILLNCLPL